MHISTDFVHVEGLKDEFFLPSLIMAFIKGKITDGMLMKKYGINIQRANKIITALQELGIIDNRDCIIKYLMVSPNTLLLYIQVYREIKNRI